MRGRRTTTDAPDPHDHGPADQVADGQGPDDRGPDDQGPDDQGMDDAGDEAERGPLRRCIVTRERQPREAMLRFVVAPDHTLVSDLAARLPGRGIWLSARQDVVQAARTKGAFARAARGMVSVPPDLLSGLIGALERRIGEHIGLARRAGQAVSGFEKAREWLQAGRAALVIQATDGSPEERSRLLGMHAGRVAVGAPLDGATLGALFGRERAVHVAVAEGRLAERLLADVRRLQGLRDPGEGADRNDEKPSGIAGRQGRGQAVL
jgi:predicted RNA-binding protein YlxR (DUF448 family)